MDASKRFSDYGHFDENARCFRLTAEPPDKWWNLHCSAIANDGREMYAETAHCNDGPIWIRDADGTTVSLVNYDQKYHYIRDDETNDVFCPSGLPAPANVDDRNVEFHCEKIVLESRRGGLHAHQRVFVPRHLPLECTTVTVTNESDRPRRVSIFSYAMFQLTGTNHEGKGVWKENFGEVVPEAKGVVVRNRHKDCPTDRFNGFLITLGDFFNANAYRDHFTRLDYSMSAPKILWGWNCDGRSGYGPDCAGIVQVKLELAPGESKRADFIIGQCTGPEEAVSLARHLKPEQLDAWCDEVKQVEDEQGKAWSVDVGHELYNGLFNIFLKKQLYTYLINKSGFRDNLQIDQALVMCNPAAAEANLVRALASQFPDGSVPHGFRPLNRHKYSDKPAWILQTLPMLIQETGNFPLLEVEVPYFESNDKGNVLDHAMRALRYLASDTGKHGFVRQHYADWNDGLEATEASGDRESIFVTLQLCLGAREMAELARRAGHNDFAEEAKQVYDRFKAHLNAEAWDGEWYIRTVCEDGYRLGSKDAKYGKIFLNPQSWAVLSGVADPERGQAIMAKVDEMLEEDIGFRICNPPYEEYDPRVGQVSARLPGFGENGGCYNHAAGFKGVADCHLGRAEQAWRTFRKVTPDNPENPIGKSGAEPFSYVNSYSSVTQNYGQKGYAWRTGTAGWFAQLLIEHILGARRGYDGLVIDPCLPKALPEAKITRRFRGSEYRITLHNRPEGGKGPKRITFNGQPLEGTTLPLDHGTHEVVVEL
ncbi:MAG: GH36-type glycosyl hydrolase domain-containing protein [Opitutales bacterium]